MTTPEVVNWRETPAGFSFTFEVEGHCLVSRPVHCIIEGRRPEPLGSLGDAPPRNF